MKTVKFGIIGCGLMGREFASAAARWCHLPEMNVKPEVVAICDTNEALLDWYTDNFASIKQVTSDYKELLANDEIDAVYCAVPHNLHQQIYCDIISAGKALLGEKPFGIDKPANDAILACMEQNPGVFVRCSSEFPFIPAVQRIGKMIEAGAFGRIIEVNSGFMHSSDLDPNKAINWKRMIDFNGEYGCMGDLGMHACHVPFRAGWIPRNVRAVLSNIMPTRPDGKGGEAPCETWDNATLLCEAEDTINGGQFPLAIKTQRIAPGEKDTWYIEIKGTKGCARFSTKNPKRLEVLEYSGGEQIWQQIDMGHETAFKSITGGIFEFGFSDAILQMWAAFLHEMTEGKPAGKFAGCV
ncbi:MAG: Gfo/Idh/MocA family oxidoreductase, partial [Phycisphaerae bacterium]|nr:Gfo/Idh/MocA family oxidoreductase [Phycisphaerae bacterium]